jgi:hypothetical protein
MLTHASAAPSTAGRSDRAPLAPVPRTCACSVSGGPCAACAGREQPERPLQRRATAPGPEPGVTPSVRRALASPGQALPPSLRATMEPLFGADFSRVRVHSDVASGASAREIAADAYTVGRDIVFAPGRFAPETRAGRELLGHELTHVVQQRAGLHARRAGGRSDEAHEREADAMGARVADATAGEWLVEDDAESVPPGRLRRADFLARLRPALCRAADAELRSLGHDTQGCPYLERAFAHYATLPAARLEVALRRFAPEAARARTAHEVIPHVAARVARGVARWAQTGELPELPGGVDLADLAPNGLLSGLGALAGPFSGLVGGLSRLFFKAAPGAPAPQATAAGVESLPGGAPLATGVRQDMSRALGQALPDVRVHTGAEAASLNTRLGSRAFTLGQHVVFGQGEYQPGTPVGDALLAHELAHVLQQGREVTPVTLAKTDPPTAADGALEADADEAAVGAVVSLWGRTERGLRDLRQKTGPRLKSGLKLQMGSCGGFQRLAVRPERQPSLQGRATAACDLSQRQDMERINTCCTSGMLSEIESNLSQAVPRVRNALTALRAPDDAAEPLRENFGVSGDDATRVGVIRGRFQQILDLMTGSDVTFLCRSRQTEPFCQPDAGGRATIASASNCARNSPLMMQFCGDYDQAAAGGTYFPSLRGSNWVKNLIHEYAHLAGSRECAMLPAGSESYRHDSSRPYPPRSPDDAVRNADSYAWFAMDVSAELRRPAPPGGNP